MNTAGVEALIEKADTSLEAARVLCERGFFSFSASRAYYAMFYCAQAVLLDRDQSYARHSAVIAAFGREFAKTGLLDQKYHRFLREAFDVRQIGDYDSIDAISKATAENVIHRAVEFISVIRSYLQEPQDNGGSPANCGRP